MKKRMLAAFLALVMVVSGIYFVKPDTEEVKAAGTVANEEVPTEMLGVKMQPRVHNNGTADDPTDDTMDLRILSSVDSLDYKEVGFYVWYDEAAKTPTDANRTAHFKTTTVFKRIGATSKVAYNFSPKMIDTCAEYFISGTIMGIKYDNWGKDFYIQAYCVTNDGQTETGVGRYFNVEDATRKEIINIPIAIPEDEVLVGDVTTVTVGGTPTDARVEAYIEGYAHLNVQVADKTKLPSATVIEHVIIPEGTDVEYLATGNKAIYRNVESELKVTTEGDTVTVTGDTSWYTAYEGEDEYVIANAADLYGFAQADTNFAGKTIYMIADIDGNDYKGTATADGFTRNDGKTPYPWSPIGLNLTSAAFNFAGTFDGQMHKISGVSLVQTGTANGSWGLFGETGACAIKNFTVANSYLALDNIPNSANIGGVAGKSTGIIDTVKIEDTVYLAGYGSNAQYVGGIVGWMSGTAEDYGKITNCWFDGQISKAGDYTGGILAVAQDGNANTAPTATAKRVEIDNCLNSGNIKLVANNPILGGICAWVDLSRITVNNSMNVSSIELNNQTLNNTLTGSVIGWIQRNAYGNTQAEVATNKEFSAVINNTYGTSDGNWKTTTYTHSNGTVCIDGTEYTKSMQHKVSYLSTATLVGGYVYENQYKNWDFSIKDVYQGKWTLTTATPVLSSFVSNEAIFDIDAVTTPITLWYENAEANATTYTLYTTADMLGFASLVREGIDFSNKTVKLGADITMNKNNVSATGFNPEVEGVEPYPWTPINITGTFDGDGHTIRGIYVDAVTGDGSVGLFSTVSGTVKNFRLQNSYFNHADKTANSFSSTNFTAPIGSVAGTLSGTIDTVYSDAFVNHDGAHAGGLVGIVKTEGAVIRNSCYAGSVTAVGSVGGILGLLVDATATIEHSMNVGTVGGGYATGGICGQVWYRSKEAKLFVKDSLNVGKHIKTSASQPWRGGIIGYLASYACADLSDIYMIGKYADGTNTWDKTVFLGSNNSSVIDGDKTYTRADNPTNPTNTSWVVQGFFEEKEIIEKTAINLSFLPEGQESSATDAYYWVARTGKIPMLESFEDLLTNVTY